MLNKVVPNKLFFAHVEDELKHGRSVRFVVNGVSMTPIIRSGHDSVTVVPLSKWGELKRHNIILFKYHGEHILHRVIAIKPMGKGDSSNEVLIETRGDGSYYAQEQCLLGDVIGVVTAIHKGKLKRSINPNSRTLRLYARLWHSMPGFFRRFSLKVLKRILR